MRLPESPWPRLGAWLDDHEIVWASALGLFLEVMVIRLHASYFQLFAYFKNISLLSSFLGLGVGLAQPSRRRVHRDYIVPLFALQALILHLAHLTTFADQLQNPLPENLTLAMRSMGWSWTAVATIGFLLFVFSFNAFCFVPVGEWIAAAMEGRPKNAAYGANLLGSLVGIGIFSAVSMLRAPPLVWLLLPAIAVMLLLRRQVRAVVASSVSLAALAFVMSIRADTRQVDFYSPYQLVSLLFSPDKSPELLVSHTYHQRILDLSPDATRRDKLLARQHYDLPYRLKPGAGNVLVMGSGTGNDVAAALRADVRHVDAVEIDPVILDLGKAWHPEKPYQSSRVTSHLADGRSFLRSSGEQYDLIVYGLLDSHALLSGMSSVRLDSYIYTVEAFREMRARLRPGGVACLSFCQIQQGIAKKLYRMLAEAFDGQKPQVYSTGYDQALAYVLRNDPSPAPLRAEGVRDVTSRTANFPADVSLSTDDWPFFYMPVRRYPTSFLLTLFFLLLISVAFVRGFLPASRQHFSFFFCLGTGFMLLETAAITRLALQYGNTWFVTSIVIALVITMAWLANRCVLAGVILRPPLLYGCLVLSLLFSWVLGDLEFASLAANRALSVFHLLPIFFSGMLFSTALNQRVSIQSALSANILGAMLGGLLEYNAMLFGFRALVLHALIFYLLAALWAARSRRLAASGQAVDLGADRSPEQFTSGV